MFEFSRNVSTFRPSTNTDSHVNTTRNPLKRKKGTPLRNKKVMTTKNKDYGILMREPGKITLWIDSTNYLKRYSLVVDVAALEEFLISSLNLMPRDINEVLAELSQDKHFNEHVWYFISLSRHEWVELDENNQPLIKTLCQN